MLDNQQDWCNFDVVLRVPVSVAMKGFVSPSRIAKMLEEHFGDYSDGRYPFNVEQFKQALNACIKRALYDAVSEDEMDLHRDEYVEYKSPDGKVTGKTAKWVLTAEKRMEKVFPYVSEQIKVSVSERPERRPGTTRS